MPAVARGNQTDSVASLTGTPVYKAGCSGPFKTTTNVCSPNVFCDGQGIVRLGDLITPHPTAICTIPDTSVLTTASSNVFVNGKGCGRLGDKYTADNTITTGSPNIFVNG